MSDWRESKGYLPAGWTADNNKLTITDEETGTIIHCDFIACTGCGGRGSCVNPSVDSHGIGAEEWETEWDIEEREGYLSGQYDIPCPRCGGLRVILQPQEDDPNSGMLERAWRDEANYRAEQEAERRMGC